MYLLESLIVNIPISSRQRREQLKEYRKKKTQKKLQKQQVNRSSTKYSLIII